MALHLIMDTVKCVLFAIVSVSLNEFVVLSLLWNLLEPPGAVRVVVQRADARHQGPIRRQILQLPLHPEAPLRTAVEVDVVYREVDEVRRGGGRGAEAESEAAERGCESRS